MRNILVLIILFFSVPAFSQDTWIQTYRPFLNEAMDDEYYVEDVIITQDGGYLISGEFYLEDEFYY